MTTARIATHRSADKQRRFGVLFQTMSVDVAASRCVKAAVSWGGVVSVYLDGDGYVTCVVPGTVAAMEIERAMTLDHVGVYTAAAGLGCGDPRNREPRKLIAGDLWRAA